MEQWKDERGERWKEEKGGDVISETASRVFLFTRIFLIELL